ncbi:MAG: RT0821/Lpp0805 family surface protein [Geminicoccaceae bacterium]
MSINPELLMRYADNEVSLPERRFIEEELSGNPEQTTLVAAFRDQRDQLRLALGADDEDGLGRSEQAIDLAFEKRRRLRRRFEIYRWGLPIAASLLITLIGGLLSFHYAERKVVTEVASVLASQAEDRNLALQTRIEALERMLSGTTLTWANEGSGAQGSITPLRTYQALDGQWCREFRETTTSPNSEGSRIGIACRDSAGSWIPPI